jgi:hypothetical protein
MRLVPKSISENLSMQLKTIVYPAIVACASLLAPLAYCTMKVSGGTAHSMAAAAGDFASTLTEEQRTKTLLPLDSPERPDWHIIPKDTRKGLQVNEMAESQREAAIGLLKSVVSQIGYRKSTQIMDMERLLKQLEINRKGGPIRDSTRYYFTLFGNPAPDGKWGLSIEGHHLSLNFTIHGDRVVSSTPQAMAANPAVVRNENPVGIPLGTRILRMEETLAFELLESLSEDQRKIAIIADKAPKETRTLGVPQPTQEPNVGIAFWKLSEPQKHLLERLVDEYIAAVPDDVAEERRQAIQRTGGWDDVHFSWEGAIHPGIGHYYRIQGKTFLIEFVNTQPDAAGNPANHIHCIWRDIRGDFGAGLN